METTRLTAEQVALRDADLLERWNTGTNKEVLARDFSLAPVTVASIISRARMAGIPTRREVSAGAGRPREATAATREADVLRRWNDGEDAKDILDRHGMTEDLLHSILHFARKRGQEVLPVKGRLLPDGLGGGTREERQAKLEAIVAEWNATRESRAAFAARLDLEEKDLSNILRHARRMGMAVPRKTAEAD